MNEKDFFKSHRRFLAEYDKLKRWYLATLLSYEVSSDEMEKIIKGKKPFQREKIYYKEEEYGETYLIQHDHRDMLKKYKKGYITFLDEMVTIRLVSLLEVHLSETLENCFYHDKKLFFTKGKYQINTSEFLYKSKEDLEKEFIEGIVDKISRGGFEELKKAYQNKLKIDFTAFQINEESKRFIYKDIKKLHDTRHLIIHQLGKTDSRYRQQYDYSKDRINLNTEEIFYYLDLVGYFVQFIKTQLKTKVLD